MSRDLTPEELQALSQWMQERGYPSYEEFCASLDRGEFTTSPPPGSAGRLKPELVTEGE